MHVTIYVRESGSDKPFARGTGFSLSEAITNMRTAVEKEFDALAEQHEKANERLNRVLLETAPPKVWV